MTWTRLHYGSMVAAVMLVSGGIVYYNHSDRPVTHTVTAERIVTLAEGVLEHTAATAPWPHTTNTSRASGFGTTTNLDEARDWSYNNYSTIPMLAFTKPRAALDESLDQIKTLVPKFVDRVEGTNVIMMSVTGVFARLNIGDGTNKWTIGYTTNGTPVYGESIGYTLCATTIDEGWAVLNVCTTTLRTVSWTGGTYKFQSLTNDPMMISEGPQPYVENYEPEWWLTWPGWISVDAQNWGDWYSTLPEYPPPNPYGPYGMVVYGFPFELYRSYGIMLQNRWVEYTPDGLTNTFYAITGGKFMWITGGDIHWASGAVQNLYRVGYTGAVPIACMATGVQSRVTVTAWADLWMHVEGQDAAGESVNWATNVYGLWSTNRVTTFEHSGVSTGFTGTAYLYPTDLAALGDIFDVVQFNNLVDYYIEYSLKFYRAFAIIDWQFRYK